MSDVTEDLNVRHEKIASFTNENEKQISTFDFFDLEVADQKTGVLFVGTSLKKPKLKGFYLTHVLRPDEVQRLAVALIQWTTKQ